MKWLAAFGFRFAILWTGCCNAQLFLDTAGFRVYGIGETCAHACLFRRGTTNFSSLSGVITWSINNTLYPIQLQNAGSLKATIRSTDGGSQPILIQSNPVASALVIMTLQRSFNNTAISCSYTPNDEKAEAFTSEALLLWIQDTLDAPGSLSAVLRQQARLMDQPPPAFWSFESDNRVSLEWSNPYTLDLTYEDPDLTNRIQIGSEILSDNTEIPRFDHSLPARGSCRNYTFTVTPVNIAGNGKSVSITVYIPGTSDLPTIESEGSNRYSFCWPLLDVTLSLNLTLRTASGEEVRTLEDLSSDHYILSFTVQNPINDTLNISISYEIIPNISCEVLDYLVSLGCLHNVTTTLYVMQPSGKTAEDSSHDWTTEQTPPELITYGNRKNSVKKLSAVTLTAIMMTLTVMTVSF